jgi:hypothetical protein
MGEGMRRDETKCNATQLQHHDAKDGDDETGKATQRARVRRREAHWCWRRWDLTINMRWGERVGGGKTAKMMTVEGEEMPRGQRFGGNGGRRRTTAIIAGVETVSLCARMLRLMLMQESFRICHAKQRCQIHTLAWSGGIRRGQNNAKTYIAHT